MITPSQIGFTPEFRGSDKVIITKQTGGTSDSVPRTLINCIPVAVTPNSVPTGGAYTASCSNYPDFAITYTDKNGTSHYLIGLKVRIVFTKGITYGSISGGTYPTLNINSTGALPLLAQGKTMATGAAAEGQTLEFTLIPYGNGVAWDADSNVRESTSDYTIYTDGTTKQLTTYPYLSSLQKDYVRTNIFPKKANSLTFYMINRYTENIPDVTDAIGDARYGTVMITNNQNNTGQCTALLTMGYYTESSPGVRVRVYIGFYLFNGVNTQFSNWKEL